MHDRAGRAWHCMSRGRAAQHAVRPTFRKVEWSTERLRLRSRSSPPGEDRRRSPLRNRMRPARRHRPASRLLPVPAARPRPLVLGYALGEVGTRPRAPKPSRWNDQRPRSWPLRLGAASRPRRARSQSAAEPDAPHPTHIRLTSPVCCTIICKKFIFSTNKTFQISFFTKKERKKAWY
jgi:hypothetical protein